MCKVFNMDETWLETKAALCSPRSRLVAYNIFSTSWLALLAMGVLERIEEILLDIRAEGYMFSKIHDSL